MAAVFPIAGLVSYWPLDEAGGTRIDVHGAEHLTDNNTVLAAAGRIGPGAQFVASQGKFLSRPTSPALTTGNIDFTIACWVKFATVGTNIALVHKNPEYDLLISDAGQFRFQIASGAIIISPPAFTPTPATWYYVLAWHDAAGDTINIQINNGAIASAPTGGGAAANLTGPLTVGSVGGGFFLDGVLDELGFWKRVLTAAERTALWNGGAGLPYATAPPVVLPFPLAGVAAYWALDEASGPRFDRHGDMHLEAHNGVGAAPGRILGAARFQQVNSQYLGRISETPLETGNIDFTLTAWINPSAPISACVVIGKDTLTGRDYALELTAAGLARFSCSRNAGAAFAESATPILAGAWSLLVAWHDATAKTLAIQVNNGAVTTASTKNVPPNVTGAEFRIGSRQAAPIADFFDGAIDEVGLWKRTLLAAERTALWNNGEGKTYPPPVVPPPTPPLVAALRERLLTLPAIFERVGTRIYTLQFPQSLTAPALRLQEIDRVSSMHLRGVGELVRARVQVDAVEEDSHGDPYARAHALAAAVRGELASGAPSGLAGFRGDLSGIPVAGILADDQRERYDAAAHLVRIEQDFIVWFAV